MNPQEARADYQAFKKQFEARGAVLPNVMSFLPDDWKHDYTLAMDAQPALSTDPNSAVPSMLTTLIDPQVFEVLFAPNKAAIILGEEKKGTWLDETAMFPIVESSGEVSSYGDFNENGHATANTNWPQRQSYLYQIIKEYGERELERAGLARINWVSQLDISVATQMNKYQNLTYFYGVQGLQNYGLFNDPGLTAAISPSTKAAGGTKWVTNGAITATANEIYADIEAIYIRLVAQTTGLVDRETAMILALSPQSEAALTATNSFAVNVSDLLKKNFPNLKVISAVQYGQLSATNPQGVAAGEFVQLLARSVEGQDTGYCAFNEKMRAHRLIQATSSYKQKMTGGTWGAMIRQPANIASMIGV